MHIIHVYELYITRCTANTVRAPGASVNEHREESVAINAQLVDASRMTTTAAQAVQQLINGVPPDYTYLLRNVFRVLVYIKSAREATYYAVDYDRLLRFQSSAYGSPYATINAFLIPVTPGRSVFTQGCFPIGSFATISLAIDGLRVICSERLTGCTMAFGWDRTNNRLLVGHVEPDGTIPEIATRANLCEWVQKGASFKGFQGFTLDRANILFVGGQDGPSWSNYENDTANVVGFLYKNAITLIVQVVTARNEIRYRWTMEFPPK